jgi:SAM-dependent methyltransferase
MIGPFSEYDAFADLYASWTSNLPLCAENGRFYRDLYLAADGPVVELGVGDGRIAVEAARRGARVTGVDSSSAMLELCRARASEAGVLDRLTLLQADFRDFVLPVPAELVAIPFHTIGHMLSRDDKRAALAHIATQLRPGGRLVFDHFVFDPELAARHEGSPRLRADTVDAESGRATLVWFTSHYDRDEKLIRLLVWSDELDEGGVLLRRRYRRLTHSWFDPDDMRALLEETGYEIEGLQGGFAGEELHEGGEQVWFARRASHRSPRATDAARSHDR